MRGGWRPVATVALVLFLGACSFGNCSPVATNVQVTPSTQPTPTPSPSASPAATPSPSPSPTPSAAPPSGAALAITSLPFHNGEVGIGYLAVFLGASGGTGSYQWSISGGTFPPGLFLSPDGTVTGKNTTAGHFNFTIKVSDSAGAATTDPAGLGVFSALSVKQPCANQCNVEERCTVCGQFGTVQGGLAPYRYAITGGSVPGGMLLNGLTLTGGFPATPLGAEYLQVTVTDVFGAARRVNANWYVFPHIAFTDTSASCNGNFNTACSAQLNYSNGTPGVNPKVTVGGDPKLGLPGGLSWAASGGVVTLTVKADCGGGAGGCGNGWSGTLTVTLTDVGPCALSAPSNSASVAVRMVGG